MEGMPWAAEEGRALAPEVDAPDRPSIAATASLRQMLRCMGGRCEMPDSRGTNWGKQGGGRVHAAGQPCLILHPS